jgi:hypothetical protein
MEGCLALLENYSLPSPNSLLPASSLPKNRDRSHRRYHPRRGHGFSSVFPLSRHRVRQQTARLWHGGGIEDQGLAVENGRGNDRVKTTRPSPRDWRNG